MELKAWTYEEMPECTALPEGASLLPTTGEECGVLYMNDVVYAKTPQGDLRLQLLIPQKRNCQPALPMPFLRQPDGSFPEGMFDGNPQYPCVIHVQGSAWGPQGLYFNLAQLAKLAARGYVVALVEYRDFTRATYPTPILDTLNAIRYLRKNAKMYCADPTRMIVSGDSSGGHTALMAGIRCRQTPVDSLYPDTSSEVCGIISFYASGDFLFEESNPSTPNHTRAGSPEANEMNGIGGGDMTPEQCAELTVRTHVTPEADIPPVLMFHGTKDRTVHTLCSVYLYEKLKACGKDASLYLLKGADHGGAEFWTDQTLDLIEDFIAKVTA